MDTFQPENLMMRAVERMRRVNMKIYRDDITAAECNLLGALCCKFHGGVNVSLLSEHLDVPMPAVSRVMRGLEQKNLIKREIDPKDRRNILVFVTEDGEKVNDEIAVYMHTFWQEVFNRLGKEDSETMLRLMNKTSDIIIEVIKEKEEETK